MTKSGKERERVAEERNVIDEKIIKEAVIEHRELYLDETIPGLKVQKDVDLDTLTEISITHKKIYRISNLQGYDMLKKLVLNSNIIEKIENLDHLVSLEWLDLSFNKITKIEGLDKLVNLTDLSLHKNRISRIEGLENLKKLQILSLGENNIESMSDVQSLRPYKSLRVLNLKGNPVAKIDTFEASVIAFLPQIQYLDFRYLQPTEGQKEYRPPELDAIVRKEDEQKKEMKTKIKEDEDCQKDEKMNVVGLRSLFQDMLVNDKAYQDTISTFDGKSSAKFRGFKTEVMVKYEADFEKDVKEYLKQSKTFFDTKVTEEEKFIQAVKTADKQAKADSVKLIKQFELKKIKAIEEYKEEETPEVLGTLAGEVKGLEKGLMTIEMLLVEQLEDLYTEFNSKLKEFKRGSSTARSEFQIRVAEKVAVYKRKLSDFTDKIRQLIKEEEEDDEDEQLEQADPLEALVKNEQKITECITNSYDSQKEYIDELIARHTRQEDQRIKTLQTRLALDNYSKNRKRVAEIFDIIALYNNVIEMEAYGPNNDGDDEHSGPE